LILFFAILVGVWKWLHSEFIFESEEEIYRRLTMEREWIDEEEEESETRRLARRQLPWYRRLGDYV
jgi:hypothetical protein